MPIPNPPIATSRVDNPPTSGSRCPDRQWERLVSELQSYWDDDTDPWGDVDEITLARYLAGECTAAERAAVERLIERDAQVKECLEAVQQAMQAIEGP